MHGVQDYLAGLAQLHELAGEDERKSAWRQGLAALGAAANQQPTPLEGLPVAGLLASAQVALKSGLVDDVSFLSKGVVATALFELAAALPQGREKRELGRRVLTALHEGDAPTFVSVARSLALGSRRALAGPAVRSRVALALSLPIGADTGVDALALALMSRPELERDWLSRPSTESLPARRLAAQVVERAACEVARRAAEGDAAGLRVFERPSVRAAWTRLLADRESLVWRRVATARGVLVGVLPAFAEEIDHGLSPRLGPPEWRRAATSLSASIGHDPQGVVARCRAVLGDEICRRDPGIRVALLYGLVRAGEEEPEAAEELLSLLVQSGDVDVLEALVELRRDHAASDFGTRAEAAALARLRALRPSTDDGLLALRHGVAQDLAPDRATRSRTMAQQLEAALQAFAEGRDLRPLTDGALEIGRRIMTDLEAAGDGSAEERQRAFRLMRELDTGLLESQVAHDLLAVGGGAGGAAGAAALGNVLARLHDWICRNEDAPLTSSEVPHLTLRLRRLRTLLHVLDVERAAGDEAGGPARERLLRAFRMLLGRVEHDPPSPLRRITCAALARACDALVRDEVCELSDVLVAVLAKVRAAEDLRVLAEASMLPELKEVLRAAAEVARLCAARPERAQPPSASAERAADRALLEAFRALAHALPPGVSPRVEGLRRALSGMARTLQRIQRARSIASLKAASEGAVSVLERLEESAKYGARLCTAARARMGLDVAAAPPSLGRALQALDAAVDRADQDFDPDLEPDVQAAVAAVRADLPAGLADVVAKVLARVASLPTDGDAAPDDADALDQRLRLPPWLPPSRILGGFYVTRAIGSGAVGSVFVARRAEERHDENAESYALKVPSYDGQNAHTLTEQQFLQLFREEAGALLTLPPHGNLAGFVTFDVRARPKPILVMELVHGPTLERLLEKRELSTALAFSLLDGVAAGLGVMHASGIGHLDVKPANVILRLPPGGSVSRLVTLEGSSPTPVLVDFGLAGRKVRPGCASPYYGAPEVWDTTLRLGTDPAPADVYAFCCMAYELFTGQPLFLADTLPALIACHFQHDGHPQGLSRLHADRRLAPLAEILAAGLCPDGRRRASIGDIRQAMQEVAPELDAESWPLLAA